MLSPDCSITLRPSGEVLLHYVEEEQLNLGGNKFVDFKKGWFTLVVTGEC
jgi:hypothetical protein